MGAGGPGAMAGAGGSQPGRAVRGVQQGMQGAGGEVVPASIDEADAARPGNVYLLKNGKPEKVPIVTGITDGSYVEVRSGPLKEGDVLIVGLDQSANRNNNNNQLAPPPGMGGPGFGRGGGGRR